MKKIKLEEEVVIEYRDSLDLHKRNINMVYKNECKASNVLEYILENYKMHLREDNEIERYFIDKIEEYILEEDQLKLEIENMKRNKLNEDDQIIKKENQMIEECKRMVQKIEIAKERIQREKQSYLDLIERILNEIDVKYCLECGTTQYFDSKLQDQLQQMTSRMKSDRQIDQIEESMENIKRLYKRKQELKQQISKMEYGFWIQLQ